MKIFTLQMNDVLVSLWDLLLANYTLEGVGMTKLPLICVCG